MALDVIWPEGVCYSVSQIKRFLDCPRAWYFEKILGFKPEKTDQQDWGTATHEYLESVLRDPRAATTVEPRWAQAAGNLERLKVRPEDIERIFMIPLGPDFEGTLRWLVGVIDFVDWRAGTHLGRAYDFEVGDHKTLRDMQWALSADALSEDLQLLTYGYAVGQELASPPRAVRVTHHSIQREGAVSSRMVSQVVSWEAIERAWARTLRVVDLMDRTRVLQSAGLADKNSFACRKYGGCPQGERCAIASLDKTKFARPHNELEHTEMSIFNRTPHNAPKPPVAPAATPTGAQSAPTPGAGLAGLKALAAARAAKAAVTASPAPAPAPEPIVAEALITGPEAVQEAAPAPAPKRGPGRPRKTPQAAVAGQAPMKHIEELERIREAQAAGLDPDAPNPEYTTPAPSPAPARVQNAAALAMTAVTPNPSDPKPIGLLLINATPIVGGSLPRAEEILEDLAAQYQAEMGHPWEAAPYREGSGAMMQGLRAKLAEKPTNLAIRSGSPLCDLAIEVLIPLAHSVIVGVR